MTLECSAIDSSQNPSWLAQLVHSFLVSYGRSQNVPFIQLQHAPVGLPNRNGKFEPFPNKLPFKPGKPAWDAFQIASSATN